MSAYHEHIRLEGAKIGWFVRRWQSESDIVIQKCVSQVRLKVLMT